MANILKMAKVQAIIGLLEQGWSYRRIARELGVYRETVARYDRLRHLTDSKPSNPTPGSSSLPPCTRGEPQLQAFTDGLKLAKKEILENQKL